MFAMCARKILLLVPKAHRSVPFLAVGVVSAAAPVGATGGRVHDRGGGRGGEDLAGLHGCGVGGAGGGERGVRGDGALMRRVGGAAGRL
jgi:hypothetical protein